MDERLNGTWQTTEEDETLQHRFWAPFRDSPLHGVIRARIGATFLRQHLALLEECAPNAPVRCFVRNNRMSTSVG
jgi:hypothetical protein